MGAHTALVLPTGGPCPPTLPQCNGGDGTSDPTGAKKVVHGDIIFQYQPSGGGDTANIHFPSWVGLTEAQLVSFNKGSIPASYNQSDIDDMWSKIWGNDKNAIPADDSFLGYLIGDNTWDACQDGQIASAPNIPTSSSDADCDSAATKISNAIHIYVGNFKGHSELVYQIPAGGPDQSGWDDLLNAKGKYFPKFYKANNHSTLGGVGLNANNNVDYFFGEGFGSPWKSLDIATANVADGPALYFGHAYQKTNVLSDAINGVLTSVYNAIAGLGNDLLHLTSELITTSKNNVISQAGVTKAWGQMRLLVDILFILVLLAIAFANTLHINIEQYGIRALLPRFIIAVVGVNFSLILVQVIIDFCTVLSKAVLGNTVGFGRLFQLNLSDFPLSDTVGLIVSIILMVVALLAAVGVVAMLVARIAALWVLAALAPLAFLCMVLPITRGLMSTWIRNVIRFALIGPLMAILLLLASDFATSQGDSVSSNLLIFLIVLGLLYAASIVPLMLGGAITSAASGIANRGKQLTRPVTQAATRKALTGRTGGQGWVGQGQRGVLGATGVRNVPFIGLDSKARANARQEIFAKTRSDTAKLAAQERVSRGVRIGGRQILGPPQGISPYGGAMELSNQAGKLDKEFSNLSMPQLHQEFDGGNRVRSLAAARRLTSLGLLGAAGHEHELAGIQQKGFENDADIYKNMRENQPHSAPAALGPDTGNRAARSAISKLTVSKLDTMSTEALHSLGTNPEFANEVTEQISPEFVTKSINGNAATAKTQKIIAQAAIPSMNGGKSILSDAAVSRLINDDKLFKNASDETKKLIHQARVENKRLVDSIDRSGDPDLTSTLGPSEPSMRPPAGPFTAGTSGPASGPGYSAWNAEDGFAEGQHGEFPSPDEGGEEQE